MAWRPRTAGADPNASVKLERALERQSSEVKRYLDDASERAHACDPFDAAYSIAKAELALEKYNQTLEDFEYAAPKSPLRHEFVSNGNVLENLVNARKREKAGFPVYCECKRKY